MRRIFEEKAKPLPINKQMVWKAYKKVKSNKGSWGVDKVSIDQFENNLENNLYKLWNRLASGSYFPPAVKEVEIPKSNGKNRQLGIPTISDRVGQEVIKDLIEPRLEQEFDNSSYGYRPFKNAHQALSVVRSNTRKYDWVIDLDITNFFDNVNHDKLMSALERHIEENWIKVYIKRWLEAPVLKVNGDLEDRQGNGTPQGGVISPLLANLYLHYTFDIWMARKFSSIPFVRYADDMVIHCKSKAQAEYVLQEIQERLKACNLETNTEKTVVVYCKDYRRKDKNEQVSFDFLGFSFHPQSKPSKSGGMFLGYNCSISQKNYSRMVKTFKDLRFDRWTGATLQDIADELNPKIRGWMDYYEKFSKGSLSKVFRNFHNRLVKWILNKYKRFKGSRRRGFDYLHKIHKHYSYIFYHWKVGYSFV
jgi:group II intron reverse transcriptase/maturase